MKYILSKTGRSLLAELAAERTLCGLDFDGTLSPIADHPDGAGMRHKTRELLLRLASLYPCIVITGRARGDVLNKLGGIEFARVIGNHGAENELTSQQTELVGRWRRVIEPELGSVPGVWVEDKGHSLAVHYRHSLHKADARRTILATIRRLENVRVIGGKQVVNVAPSDAPNKGDALIAERDHLRCKQVIYVGDDENDEDAFAFGDVVSIRVGRKLNSKARYYLRNQAEIDDLLEALVKLREKRTEAETRR